MTAARLGARSALAVLGIGAAYVVVLTVGVARHGLAEPIADPVLAVMEVLTIASALPLLGLCVALRAVAEPSRQLWGTLAVCVASAFAATTIGVHFAELSAGRQMGSPGLAWPSVPYAVELFAWDLLLGVALLLAAATLDVDASARWVRRGLQLTDVLCLAGLVGPLSGNMRLQLIGVAGYAVVLPGVAYLLHRWFRGREG